MSNNVRTDSKSLKLAEVKIKYVGPAVRRALEKGGIHTVAELATSSVEDIESILEHELPAPARTAEKIAKMIQQAQELAAAAPNRNAQTDRPSTKSKLAKVPEFTLFFNYGYIENDQRRWRALIHPHADGDKPEPPAWHPDPEDEGYTVRFERSSSENKDKWRTVIYNGKSLEETDITGWTPDQWWPWIAEKASLNEEAIQAAVLGQEVSESMLTPVNDQSSSVRDSLTDKPLTVTRFEIQVPSDNRANILVANVEFEISEETLAQQTSQFQIEILYVDLHGETSHLAGRDDIKLEPDQRRYESWVEFPIPKFGRYQPYCIVLLLPSGEFGDYQEDKIFNVVPKAT